MTLIEKTKAIQRICGTQIDGVYGPATADAILTALGIVKPEIHEPVAPVDLAAGIDSRSAKNIATLDPLARPKFEKFHRLAQATAADLGCSYVMIGGNRTWAEQDALYAIGRTKPGNHVTKAKGGQSNHNFGIAGDFGVFQGGRYLDDTNPALAAKVHKACSEHAAACGLEWGGSWKTFKDLPHYEVATGLTMAQKRDKYQATRSVLA